MFEKSVGQSFGTMAVCGFSRLPKFQTCCGHSYEGALGSRVLSAVSDMEQPSHLVSSHTNSPGSPDAAPQRQADIEKLLERAFQVPPLNMSQV